eukprot:2663776-Pleurochrysis_carterae.AAC.1
MQNLEPEPREALATEALPSMGDGGRPEARPTAKRASKRARRPLPRQRGDRAGEPEGDGPRPGSDSEGGRAQPERDIDIAELFAQGVYEGR